VSTIASYESLVGPFFRFFPKIHFRQITQANFEEFEEINIKQRELSVAYKRQLVNALKRFWECYDYRFSFQCSQLELPSREEYVPDTLSEHDVRSLLACATDLRRELMLTLIYAFGLRSNELREIRLRDFSLGKKRLTLRAGTRGLRRVMFEENLKGKLHEYLVAYHPNVFLFESRPGTPYTQRRIQQICSEAGQAADLGKRVSPAVLRQSFGMHMLKNGARVETVQWLMGHRHIKSTERYVQAVR
jgi:integrase/recombinase XerD